jgi:hypothetical protein
MVSLVRSHYSLATTDTDQRTGKFGKEGKKELGKASAAWKRYLAAEPKKPDASLAGVMVLAYGKDGLNQPPNAAEAAEIVATVHDDAPSWLALATYAKAAGQDRKAELAGKKAIEKAPKAQKDDYKKQVKGLLSGAGEQTVQPSGG